MSIDTYAKTAASAAGGIVAWGTAAAALFALVPDKRVAGAVAALLLIVHTVQSFSVWLTANTPVIDADLSAAQKIVDMVRNWEGTLDELKTIVTRIMSAFSGIPPTHPPAAESSADRHV